MKLNKQELEIIAQSIIDNINRERNNLYKNDANKIEPKYIEFFNQFEKELTDATEAANNAVEKFKTNLLSLGFNKDFFQYLYLRKYTNNLDYSSNRLNPGQPSFQDTFVGAVSRYTSDIKLTPSLNQIKADLIMTNLSEDGFDIDTLISKISSKYI